MSSRLVASGQGRCGGASSSRPGFWDPPSLRLCPSLLPPSFLTSVEPNSSIPGFLYFWGRGGGGRKETQYGPWPRGLDRYLGHSQFLSWRVSWAPWDLRS